MINDNMFMLDNERVRETLVRLGKVSIIKEAKTEERKPKKHKSVTVPHYNRKIAIVDHHHVHAAIAAGLMPPDCAPINLENVRRWAQSQKLGELHGVLITAE